MNQVEMKRICVSDLNNPCGRTEAASASSMFVFLPVQITPHLNDLCLLKLCRYHDLPPAAFAIWLFPHDSRKQNSSGSGSWIYIDTYASS